MDRPRLLHRRSELGYTDRTVRSLSGEPEAVPANYQRQLTAAAPKRAAARDHEVWIASRDRIVGELDRLRGHRFARDVTSELRVIERQLARIGERLAA